MKKVLISILVGLSITVCGCTSNKPAEEKKPQTPSSTAPSTPVPDKENKENTPKVPGDGNSTPESKQKTFTIDELKKYDGQNGNPAYAAVDGIVYDVTHAKKWNNGKHESGVTAGKDLTKAIASSPHGKDVLKDVPVVGTLK